MLLKTIPIFLNVVDYKNPLGSEFLFGTHYLTSFLSRKLRPLKFKSDGFFQICIEGCREPGPCRIVNRSALVPLHFDRPAYEALSPDECHGFRVKMATEGIRKCSSAFDIPAEQILAFVQEFVDGNYVNHWVHRRQRLRPGLWATLKCEVSPERFRLRLELSSKSGVFFDEQILETLPDSLIYKYQFVGASLEGKNVVVVNKFGDPIYQTPVPASQDA
jgi:hypothetical protein